MCTEQDKDISMYTCTYVVDMCILYFVLNVSIRKWITHVDVSISSRAQYDFAKCVRQALEHGFSCTTSAVTDVMSKVPEFLRRQLGI